MNIVRVYLLQDNDHTKSFGLAMIRIGIGAVFMYLGLHKLLGGHELWQQLGTSMSYVGIHFWPELWGFLAAITEFFGGLLFATGFMTRAAAFFLSIVMFVATIFLLANGKDFAVVAQPLTLLITFMAFVVMGAGRYSLDYKLYRQ